MASEPNQRQQQLHFVMVPFLSLGHLIPMADIARVLAHHGAAVTMVTTPINAARIAPMMEAERAEIRIAELHLPAAESGLPEGCESMEFVPSRSMIKNFIEAINKLQEPMEELIKGLNPTPTSIVADKFLYWMEDVANKFKIPRLMFDGTGCINLLILHTLLKSKVHESVQDPREAFVVPGLPHRIELTKVQLPMDLNPSTPEFKENQRRMREAEESVHGVIVNSFEELELDYVRGYEKAKGKKVWCIGPLSLSYNSGQDVTLRGSKATVEQGFCLRWLDSWPQGSVVYVCLGTLNRMALPQFQALALALEGCNCPFVWVVKEDDSGEARRWMVESCFEERTNGRGLIVRGWAPQVAMLSHAAVGAFLTHCGWNSTLEGICAGLPMVTWPMFADQFFNEKLVVEILGIGVALGNEVTVPLGKQEQFGVGIKKERIVEAIEEVIGEGTQKEARRERGRKLAELAKKSVEPGGSSYLNVKMLLQDMEKIAFGNQHNN